MSPFVAFILGLLIGWLVEWVIDWVYWRRRTGADQSSISQYQQRIAALEQEISVQKQAATDAGQRVATIQGDLDWCREESKRLQERISLFEREGQRAGEVTLAAVEPPTPAEPPVPDDLIVIKGIGPVIARMLNDAGIYTFEQLAAQTPASLRAILGNVIERLSDEESILSQARQLAERKSNKTTGGQ